MLNWNQLDLTSACLKSLAQQDYPNYQVLLVDNGSTDGSARALHDMYPWVRIIEIPQNVGYSAANNVGIEHALEQGTDYVLLLNNDTQVDQRMLSQLVSAAESDPSVGIVGPTMYYWDPPDMIWGGDNRIDWKRARLIRRGFGNLCPPSTLCRQAPRDTDYVDTCAILAKRKVFQTVGLLDTRYFINFDDLDWNVRARKAGYRILYVPAACMWHKVSATMGIGSPATTYYMTRNALLFFRTHAPGPWRILAPFQIILRTVRTIAAWSLKPRYRGEVFRRKRDANLLALRDFFAGRFGRMGRDVARICYSE